MDKNDLKRFATNAWVTSRDWLERRCVWRCLPLTSSRLVNNDTEQSEIEALVALFVVLIINIGAATLSEYEKGPRPEYILMYALVGFVVLVPMLFIVSQTSVNSEGHTMYRYNRATIAVGKWLIFWSLLFYCPFVVLASRGEWFGQKRADLVVNDTVLTSFTNGVPCLRLKVVARPKHFGGRVPSDLKIVTVLGQELHANWQLHKASWYVPADTSLTVEGEERPRPVLEEALVRRTEDTPTLTEPIETEFEGLQQGDATYVLNLDLRPTAAEIKGMASEYANAKSAEAKAALREKWKLSFQDEFESARDEIMTRGAVRLWWKEPTNFWGRENGNDVMGDSNSDPSVGASG